MGATQTCAITVGFTCIHLGLFMAIISLNSTHLIGTCDASTEESSYGVPKTTQVYWHVCTCEGCSLLNDKIGLKYSHIMFTAGTAMLTLATVGMYCYLVLGCLTSSIAISILHVVTIFLACGCLISSQVLFHLNKEPVTSRYAITQIISWPFYVSLVTTVMTTIAFLAALERTRVICAQQKGGYSDVDK